jgi:hypothetical protein
MPRPFRSHFRHKRELYPSANEPRPRRKPRPIPDSATRRGVVDSGTLCARAARVSCPISTVLPYTSLIRAHSQQLRICRVSLTTFRSQSYQSGSAENLHSPQLGPCNRASFTGTLQQGLCNRDSAIGPLQPGALTLAGSFCGFRSGRTVALRSISSTGQRRRIHRLSSPTCRCGFCC